MKTQVMGMYPGDPGDPGLDCSGTVVNVEAGKNKGGLRCGDDAFGIVWGCLKTYVSWPSLNMSSSLQEFMFRRLQQDVDATSANRTK